MKNIYDVFEENSSLYNLLKENEEEIIKNQNEIIEWQVACYMEDLVLEQMMYEDFNADEMEFVIEESLKKRLSEGAVKLKLLINKFLAWLDDVYIDFSKKMNVFKKIFDSYGRKNIHNALVTSEIKIKVIDFNGAGMVMQKMDENIKFFNSIIQGSSNINLGSETNQFKNEVLKHCGSESTEDLKSKTISLFINNDKPVVKQIKDLDPTSVIGWLEGVAMKWISADLKLLKRQLGAIKLNYSLGPDKKTDVVKNLVVNSNFLINIIKTLISVIISYTFRITTICKTIILRILGKTDKESRPDKNDRSNDHDNYWE